jgi:hypothetical protein
MIQQMSRQVGKKYQPRDQACAANFHVSPPIYYECAGAVYVEYLQVQSIMPAAFPLMHHDGPFQLTLFADSAYLWASTLSRSGAAGNLIESS